MLVIFKTAEIKVISYKSQDVLFFTLPIILLKRSPFFYTQGTGQKVWSYITLLYRVPLLSTPITGVEEKVNCKGE